MTRWFSPGRIEVLGKHTDYAGGQSLIMALDRGVTVDVRPAPAGVTASTDAVRGAVELRSATDLPDGHWANYLRVILGRLERNFGRVAPCTIDIASTLPLASGMSSSSALLVATAMALVRFNGFDGSGTWTREITSPEALSTYLACIENGSSFGDLAGDKGVGTFGGSEDHTAMVCCHEDHVTRFRFGPAVRQDDVRVPDGLTFVAATSGVLAEKTGAARDAYNRASLTAQAVTRRWNDATGRADAHLGAAIASAPDAADRLTALVADDQVLADRLGHFLAESDRLVPGAASALAAGDLISLGGICDESQRLASTLLRNQVPETDRLAALARSLGAHASSAFGAGFGGSVWALTDVAGASDFAADWLAAYRAEFPQHALTSSALVSRPSGPQGEIVA
ncbi:galactokinase family protein [Tessaracoccus lacteus]|uniref:Galactokinase family protein n=1 Tax=Tessaracoccus lacteus TaxID=3041766 RepID=A0ABY8PXS2_9ACTN|nr:galactokinase family protein [Tessaracoccus sp. T21]WGT47312.1 galactokinase family protein [Tessaracoccus sp. T21]